jgi:hypothetical protein
MGQSNSKILIFWRVPLFSVQITVARTNDDASWGGGRNKRAKSVRRGTGSLPARVSGSIGNASQHNRCSRTQDAVPPVADGVRDPSPSNGSGRSSSGCATTGPPDRPNPPPLDGRARAILRTCVTILSRVPGERRARESGGCVCEKRAPTRAFPRHVIWDAGCFLADDAHFV